MMKNVSNVRVAASLMLSWPCCALGVVWAQDGSPVATPLATAQAEMVTDRPDFTESASSVPSGRVQIEAGATSERAGSVRQRTLGEVLVRAGIGKRAEVRIGVPSYLVVRDGGRSRGLDDAFLGTKIVLSTRPRLQTALLAGSTLPTGSRRVAARRYQPKAVLAADLTLSPRVGLGLNLGAGRPSEGGARFTQVFASASLGFEVSDKVGGFAEVYGFNRTEAGGSSQNYFDTGLTYALSPNLQVDARAGFGLGNGVGGPDYFYGAGVSRRF